MPTCIFCDNPAGNREHVWPKWVLDRKDFGAFRLKRNNGPEIILNNTELTVKTVCQTCNNGWMSALESEAMPILSTMFDDQATPLNSDEQQILARWLMKTAMVFDSSKGRSAPHLFYTRDECVAFRQSFQMPQPTIIWIGRLDESHRDITGTDFAAEIESGRLNGTVMTLTNEHFVAQVVSLHLPQTPTAPTGIPLAPKPGNWQNSLTKIWPPEQPVVNWAPPASFTNGGLGGYAYLLDRWRIGEESDGPIPS